MHLRRARGANGSDQVRAIGCAAQGLGGEYDELRGRDAVLHGDAVEARERVGDKGDGVSGEAELRR